MTALKGLLPIRLMDLHPAVSIVQGLKTKLAVQAVGIFCCELKPLQPLQVGMTNDHFYQLFAQPAAAEGPSINTSAR